MSLLFVFGSCGGAGNGPDADARALPIPTGAAAPAPLRLRLELPERARLREPVRMRLVLSNPGGAPVEVGLGGSPIAFDLLVLTPAGATVWRRLEGVAVEAILQPRTLGPGEEMEFVDAWRQQDDRGRPVGPGPYRVRGILPVVGVQGGWTTETRTLTILP